MHASFRKLFLAAVFSGASLVGVRTAFAQVYSCEQIIAACGQLEGYFEVHGTCGSTCSYTCGSFPDGYPPISGTCS
jgi:hypothetical protein